jgi:hypothetical protein
MITFENVGDYNSLNVLKGGVLIGFLEWKDRFFTFRPSDVFGGLDEDDIKVLLRKIESIRNERISKQLEGRERA